MSFSIWLMAKKYIMLSFTVLLEHSNLPLTIDFAAATYTCSCVTLGFNTLSNKYVRPWKKYCYMAIGSLNIFYKTECKVKSIFALVETYPYWNTLFVSSLWKFYDEFWACSFFRVVEGPKSANHSNIILRRSFVCTFLRRETFINT